MAPEVRVVVILKGSGMEEHTRKSPGSRNVLDHDLEGRYMGTYKN